MSEDTAAHTSYYDGQVAEPRGPSIIWRYLGILRRRIWIVLPLALITGTLGVLNSLRTPDVYRASARVLVERNSPRVMQFEEGLHERNGWDPDYYSTQVELLKSRAVMEVAVEQPALRRLFEPADTDESVASSPSLLAELKRTLLSVVDATPPPLPEPWELLSRQIRVTHVSDTHFIEVSVLNLEPSRAALIANTVADAFQEYHRQHKTDVLGQAFVAIQEQKDREALRLLEAEQELQRFRESAKSLTVASSEDQPVVERLNRLNNQLTEVQLSRIEISSQIAVMNDVLEGRGAHAKLSTERLFSMPMIQDDADLTQSRNDLADAEKALAEFSATYGAEHPVLKAAVVRADLLREQFKAALKEVVNAEENRFRALAEQEAELQAEYEAQKKAALDLAKEAFTYTRLMNEVERRRRLFDALMERMHEVDVTSEMPSTNVQVVDRAARPSSPIGAGKVRTIALAVFVGILFGSALAFVIENLDDTIKTPEDLRERLKIPLLGFVPAIEDQTGSPEGTEASEDDGSVGGGRPFRDIRPTWRERIHNVLREFIPSVEEPIPPETDAGRAHRGRITINEPMSSITEAYRGIRASLFYATPSEEIKTLSVTSCRPREGKTTTSANLALSIAQTGKKVLLIDGDLHRPSVHRTLDIPNDRGLTSVLVGEVGWNEALTPVIHEGAPLDCLDVMTAGPKSPAPSELLDSQRMKQLLETVRAAYDWVIVDTPPVLFVSDARILSVLCDGVLVVVRAGTSTRSLVARTQEQLLNVRARLIGSILNNVRVSRVGRNYSSYYVYGYSRYAKDYKSYYYNRTDREEGSAEVADGDAKAGKAKHARRKKRSERDRSESVSRRGKDKAPEAQAPAKPVEAPMPPEVAQTASRPMTPLEQAALHLQAGNPGRSRTLLLEQVGARPDALEAWELLLSIDLHQKNEEGLQDTLRRYRTVRGGSGHVPALGEGYIALLLGDLDLARARVEEVLAMRPRSTPGLEAALRVALEDGNFTAVSSLTGPLLEVDPENAYGNYALGTLELVQGRYAEAEEALCKSLQTRRSPEVLNDLAWLLHELGRSEEAEKMARSALQMDSGLPQAWDTLATILMAADRLDDAEHAFHKAQALDSQDAGTLLRHAALHLKRGDRQEAAELAGQIHGVVDTLAAAERDDFKRIRDALDV